MENQTNSLIQQAEAAVEGIKAMNEQLREMISCEEKERQEFREKTQATLKRIDQKLDYFFSTLLPRVDGKLDRLNQGQKPEE